MKLILAALLALTVTSVPLSTLVYWYTPTPQYVNDAREKLSQPLAPEARPNTQVGQLALREIQDVRDTPITNNQENQLSEDVRQSAAALTWIPAVYSITSGIIMGWCLTLFGAYYAAKRAHVQGHRNFTADQSAIFSGLLVLLIVNFSVVMISNHVFVNMIDSVIMWNIGMLAVLTYVSTTFRQSKFFKCYATEHDCLPCVSSSGSASSVPS